MGEKTERWTRAIQGWVMGSSDRTVRGWVISALGTEELRDGRLGSRDERFEGWVIGVLG